MDFLNSEPGTCNFSIPYNHFMSKKIPIFTHFIFNIYSIGIFSHSYHLILHSHYLSLLINSYHHIYSDYLGSGGLYPIILNFKMVALFKM
ncbi:hypothetical protein CAEBREN_22573 [Caenorhabditis brenneri]|uniref:Uncharacterized protein n=1 Tax=Caenorhabditis brenneri TaxID=135651 RepID=G0P500_CAEBE|nr:hypothetical protein CAEBREN_22573 [Caenorhabditis brenneri]